MRRRFVFLKEVKELVAKGVDKIELPKGARISDEAADLIKEKGIKVIFGADDIADNLQRNSEFGRSKVLTEKLNTNGGQRLVAVASDGKSETDFVSRVAARSPYFLLFNEEAELVEIVENPYRNIGGGAGPLVAEFLAAKGVTTIVAGNFGMNIKRSLEQMGLEHFEFQGEARKAAQRALGQTF